MTLAESLTSHYVDAGMALNDGVVQVNGETQFSAHRELQPGDVVTVEGIVNSWTIQTEEGTL